MNWQDVTALVQHVDNSVLDFFQAHQTPVLTYNALNITALGSTTTIILLGLFLLGYLMTTAQFFRGLAAVVVIAGAVTAMEFIKVEVERERPDPPHHIIPRPNSPSFPSGHSTASMCGFLVLCRALRARWYAFFFAFSLSVFVGLTRMYAGVHWCSDVLAGWLLGWTFFMAYWWADSGGTAQPIKT